MQHSSTAHSSKYDSETILSDIHVYWLIICRRKQTDPELGCACFSCIMNNLLSRPVAQTEFACDWGLPTYTIHTDM